MSVVLLFSCFSSTTLLSSAASKTPATAYAAVKKAYGKKFMLGKKDRITGKNVIFGVRLKGNVSSYYAAQKLAGKSKREYAIFICKASNKNKVTTIKNALAKWKNNEKSSLKNYLDSTGKKLFSNIKIGNVGNFVYMVMLDTSNNTKAVNAIKKSLK